MSIPYQPGVRVVLGYAGRADNPPESYASAPTLALQKAVAKRSKDWKKVAPMFVVAPAARSGRVVVGLAMARVPVILEAARALEPNGAITKTHFVTQGGFRSAPDVDRYGNVQADQGILDGLAAGASDPAIAGLGLELEGTDGPASYFLVSDDGRAGAMVFGQALQKLGAPYEGGGVRTFSRDYGGGEGVRLIGLPYAEVGPESPVARIDSSHPARAAHQAAATEAVKALLDTQAAWGWYLVCDEAPIAVADAPPKAEAEEVPALAESFRVRPLDACVAALAAIEGGDPLAPQALDAPEVKRAYSRETLADAVDGARTALYELRDAPDAASLADPARLVARASRLDAIGAWNANASGRWASGDGWIVADVELASEQADEAFDSAVGAIVALFSIEGGWALAVGPGSRHEPLARVLGFDPWARSAWQACAFWLGE